MNLIYELDNITKGLEKAKAKNQEKLIKKAYKECGKVIQQDAKKNLRKVTSAASHKNYWNGKRLDAGIKVSVQPNVSEGVKVHLMKDFRLNFFEKGTVDRYTKTRGSARKGHYTGRIEPNRFFKKAVEADKDKIKADLNKALGDIIEDINNVKVI